MSLVVIDLTKNPEIASLLSDAEPGKKIYGCFTLKSRDDQTAQLRISEMTDDPDELPKPDEYHDEDEGDMEMSDEEADGGDDTATKTPTKEPQAKTPGKALAEKLSAASYP